MEAVKHVKYGVFWTPPAAITAYINKWKQAVRKLEPLARYLEHPVHTTFFLLMGSIEDEDSIIAALKKLAQEQQPITVNFDKWLVFKNDLVTGADTLTIAISVAEALHNLQTKITVSLQPFKKQNVPYNIDWQGPFLESYNNYGFPFCGKHWLPHISVASVTGKAKSVIDSALQVHDLPAESIIDNISLYKIHGDQHTHISTIQFK